MKKIRITIVVDDYKDGAGNIAQILALQQLKVGNIISLLTLNCHSEPRYELDGIHKVETVIGNKVNTPMKLLQGVHQIKKILVSFQSDVVISFLTNNNILILISSFFNSVPVIACERSNPVAIVPSLPWKILQRIAYRRADMILVQFDCFQEFDNGRYRGKCNTIPNIIENADIFKMTYQHVEPDKVRYVAVGRINEIKNYLEMVNIIKELHNRGLNAFLSIYGEGNVSETKILLDWISSCGMDKYITLCGYVDKVYSSLIMNDIYLMTSIQEGFPNALSEAMAVGMPCVAYKCHDGFAELIENNNNGYLISPGDMDKYVDTAEMLAKNVEERAKIGLNARKSVERYSEPNIIGLWNQYIDSVAVGNRNGGGQIK